MRAVNEMNLNQMDDSTPRALLSQKSGPKASRPKTKRGFIKGPLDLQWIQAACVAKAASVYAWDAWTECGDSDSTVAVFTIRTEGKLPA